MKSFMNEDFLLDNETSRTLYHNYASKTPIIDYHCHINPQEIAENRTFSNITKVWLGGDHYKWRLMRAAGVPEAYITGDAPDEEKFQKWAMVLGNSIGNPIYHWSHLELKRYFNYEGCLNEHTAKEVYDMCSNILKSPSMSARGLILQSNVTLLCTTDDPADSLKWHKLIAADPTFSVKVLPTFRPDKAMNIESPDYVQYLSLLGEAAGKQIHTFDDLKEALEKRMDYFAAQGCKISDHGSEYILYAPADEANINEIFRKRLSGICLSKEEENQFKTAFLLFAGRQYHKRNWAMQLHFGCRRSNNTMMLQSIGPDTGFDCISSRNSISQIAAFLNALCITDEIPKTILYSLNPNDNDSVAALAGCFQDSGTVSKIQMGCAWWFNDHKKGITDQLTTLSYLGYLAGFVGMLTDSRSFLSYTRHEYFRRILCNLIGTWVENGEFLQDYDVLGSLVKNISYENAKNYFGFPLTRRLES